MKPPIGAPSRSVNPLQSLKDEIIRRAQADRSGLEGSIAKMQGDRYTRRTKELSGRTNQELAEAAASQLNRMGRSQATPMSARGMIEALGVVDAAKVTPDDLRANIAAGRANGAFDQTTGIPRAMAESEGPGLMERLRRLQLHANEQLQAEGTRGDIARAGVVTAATGGSAMGLTAAGQGLIALMEYIQSGTEQQEARNSELA
jgi:hypothetical protein